jgi:hypothetical protein
MQFIGPLSCLDDAHWALLPKFLTRVENFCNVYPTDLLFETLREYIIANFRLPGSTAMGAWVAMADTRVVGHILTSVEPRGREKVGFLVQIECDQRPTDAERRESMAQIRKWARVAGVRTLEGITWLPPAVFARYGFTTHRTIIRAPVDEDPT